MEIIGRIAEKAVLKRCFDSNRPEFLAVYGRRRVGKTFLIREYFKDDIVFAFTGAAKASKVQQMANFGEAVREYGGQSTDPIKDWSDAFLIIKQIIKGSDKARKVVFIDELPWLATHKSNFVSAMEYFWNSWGSARADLLLVICGSATSWIIDNVIHEHGGLYGRITRQLAINPFSLLESEQLYNSRGIALSRYQISELYMVLGGIPYYLDYVDKGDSSAQSIDKMFFCKTAPLKREFQDLYASLFKDPQKHLQIVETLGTNTSGLTRDEIIEQTKIPSGGQLSKTLRELEQCGFIEAEQDFTRNTKDSYYKLIDFFTLFYLRYIRDNQTKGEHYWQNKSLKGEQLAWYGIAFERLCNAHVSQIKQRLGISGVSTRTVAWRSKISRPATQIDLIIDRDDGIINLCEMKFSLREFSIDKSYDQKLRERREIFREETGTRKALHTTFVTSYGISQNAYYGEVQSEVTLDDLFL